MRYLFLLLIIFALFAVLAGTQAPALAAESAKPAAPQTEEEKMGAKAAQELEKTLKPIPNHPELPRLQKIANQLAHYSERPDVVYTVKVVSSKAINAVSLPGGRLYITEGALAAVESDDELAAVLAHEIAHNALRHAMQERQRASHADLGLIVGILAGVLSGHGEVAYMAAEIQEGALNHYGRKAELEADRHGLDYLVKAGYKPTAMLTVLEGLEAMEESSLRPEVLTTGDTHPLARERVHAMQGILTGMRVNIAAERRLVTNRYKIEVKPVDKEGRSIAEITLNGKTVFSPAQPEGAATPLQRAQGYAEAMKQAFDQGIQLIDLKVAPAGNDRLVMAKDAVLIKVTSGDAEFHKQTAQALAEQAEKAIELALYAEKVSRPF